MADDSKVREAVEWFSKNRVIYEALSKKAESIVYEILKSEKFNYHSITSRCKPLLSYETKASKEKYKEPLSEIKDMAGVRIVTYTNDDARGAAKIVKEAFHTYPKYSVDKAEELGVDKIGYLGIHYVADLGKERHRLPECRIFDGHVFEIQIRSILQHAWAEFEHDRNYKFAGSLPKGMQRRLLIAAANLESVDREFDNISRDIDAYTNDVKRRDVGSLSVPINSTSLKAYLEKKFENLVNDGVVEPIITDQTLNEVALMGIQNLEEFNKIIPEDYETRLRPVYLDFQQRGFRHAPSFVGLVRNLLIIADAEKYFANVWNKEPIFSGIDEALVSLFKSYAVDIDKYIKLHDLDISKRMPKSLENAKST